MGKPMTIIRDHSHIEEGLEALAGIDPRLSAIIEVAGPVPLRLQEPGFAGLASIVVSQMVSKASAAAIWRRITAAGPVTAASYLAHDPAVVATFGLSRAKAATLIGLSRAISENSLDLESIGRMEPRDAITALIRLPGIGPWTAEVYLMFSAGHADIFPSGDVALQASVAHAFGLEARPSSKKLAELAEIWSPWRSVAARLFWAYYAARMRRDVTPLP